MSMIDGEKAATLARAMSVLAHPSALRLLGHLAEAPVTLGQLADRTGFSNHALGSHLGTLVAAGIVNVDRTTSDPIFALDEAALRHLDEDAHALLAGLTRGTAGNREQPSEGSKVSSEEKVIHDFFVGPRLKQIPARRNKLLIVLRHLLRQFDPGREYPEKEVNAILRVAHEDVATLRRDLVDFGFMVRAHGVYRVAEGARERTSSDSQAF
ncbi:MAG: DUF2087 domain-containing protein [Chloroflexota bacterium]|nr:DUF2087 domain-containing protein [Chloroflexota bacterium]